VSHTKQAPLETTSHQYTIKLVYLEAMSQTKQDTLARANNDAYFRSRKAITDPLSVAKGDRVAYTRYFLRATGEPPVGDRWHDRGTVLDTKRPFVLVRWDDHQTPVYVNPVNLAHVGNNYRFAD
jgi:hypothetical protein